MLRKSAVILFAARATCDGDEEEGGAEERKEMETDCIYICHWPGMTQSLIMSHVPLTSHLTNIPGIPARGRKLG